MDRFFCCILFASSSTNGYFVNRLTILIFMIFYICELRLFQRINADFMQLGSSLNSCKSKRNPYWNHFCFVLFLAPCCIDYDAFAIYFFNKKRKKFKTIKTPFNDSYIQFEFKHANKTNHFQYNECFQLCINLKCSVLIVFF